MTWEFPLFQRDSQIAMKAIRAILSGQDPLHFIIFQEFVQERMCALGCHCVVTISRKNDCHVTWKKISNNMLTTR